MRICRLSFAMAMLLAIGCGDEDPGLVTVETCGDSNCDPGEDADNCPADCTVGACGDNTCDAGEDADSCPADCVADGCEADEDCGADQICEADTCVDGCREDSNCGEGQLCLEGACVAEVGCEDSSDCEEGEVCLDGECVQDEGQCLDDANESNDNTAEASDVGAGTFAGLTVCGLDNDYFSYTLEAGDTLVASTSVDPTGDEVSLQIVDEDSQPVARGTNSEGVITATTTAEEAVTLFVRVFSEAEPADETNATYDLTVSVTPQGGECIADESEPNNDTESATTLNTTPLTQTACAADEDFFTFTVGEGQTASVTISFENDEGDLTLDLFEGENLLDTSDGEGNTETVTAPTPGVFIAKVTTKNQVGGSDYTISLTLQDEGGCPADQFEPNNTLETASPIEAGAHPGLNVCGFDDDFYAVTLGPLDTITVTLNFTDALGDVDMSFLDPNGFFLDGSAGVGDSEQVTVEATVGGVYFIEVEVLGDANDYDMTISIVEGPEAPECADEFEDNNTVETATPLTEEVSATVCEGDPDVFSIEVTEANSLLELVLDAEVAFGDIDIQLFDTDGETLIEQTAGFFYPETLQALVSTPGTYFATVIINGDTTAYSLSAFLTPPPACEDSFEPNEGTMTATPLSLDGIEDAMACEDDSDFYELEILESFTLVSIFADFEDSFGQVDMELLDTDGVTILAEGNNFGPGEFVEFLFENTGIFYLRVFLGSGINTAYDLEMSTDILPDCSDSLEPNNSINEASSITPDSYELTVCDGIDGSDFFSIEVTEASLFEASINFDSINGDIDMELFDTDGESLIDSSRGVGNSESVSARLEPGTYFVHVFMLSFGGASEYEMTVGFIEAAECVDSNEPNNSIDLATSLAETVEGAVACDDGDVDFYIISVPEGGSRLDINARFSANLGNIDLTLLGPDGETVLAQGTSLDNNESIRFVVPEAGLYFVKAELVSGQNTAYTISAGITDEVSCDDAFEENDTLDTASPITPGDYQGLTVCENSDLNQLSDRDDFYVIYLEENDDINIDIFFAHADGDIDLRLTDGNGGFIESSGSSSDDEQISATVEADGFYIIQVLMFSSGRRSTYSMTIDAPERTPPVCEDDINEPNNDALNATLLDGEVNDFTSCISDPDFFRVNVGEGLLLRATLSFIHNDGNLALDLVDTDGETLLLTSDVSNEGVNNEEFVFRAPATGDYFLRVRGAGFSSNTYSLSSEILEMLPVGPCVDRFEPNNSPGTAAPLEPGVYTDLDICVFEDPSDFYAVEIPDNSILRFTATFDSFISDLGVRIIGPDRQTVVATIDSFDDNESGSLITGEDNGGTYYLEIFNGFFGDDNTYDLEFTVEENNCVDDGREPDSAPFSAPVLDPGTYPGQICSGDSDFIQFIADADQIVEALLSFTSEEGNLGLRLLDQDGETVLEESDSNFSNTERILHVIPEAGIYFLEVFGSGLDQNSYELVLGLPDDLCNDEFEPNNTPQEASTIEFGSYEGMDLCRPDIDSTDIYGIELEANQSVRVVVSFSHSSGDIDMAFLDTDGVTILDSSGGTSDTESVTVTASEAGIYFIEVLLFTNPGQNSYSMDVEAL